MRARLRSLWRLTMRITFSIPDLLRRDQRACFTLTFERRNASLDARTCQGEDALTPSLIAPRLSEGPWPSTFSCIPTAAR